MSHAPVMQPPAPTAPMATVTTLRVAQQPNSSFGFKAMQAAAKVRMHLSKVSVTRLKISRGFAKSFTKGAVESGATVGYYFMSLSLTKGGWIWITDTVQTAMQVTNRVTINALHWGNDNVIGGSMLLAERALAGTGTDRQQALADRRATVTEAVASFIGGREQQWEVTAQETGRLLRSNLVGHTAQKSAWALTILAAANYLTKDRMAAATAAKLPKVGTSVAKVMRGGPATLLVWGGCIAIACVVTVAAKVYVDAHKAKQAQQMPVGEEDLVS